MLTAVVALGSLPKLSVDQFQMAAAAILPQVAGSIGQFSGPDFTVPVTMFRVGDTALTVSMREHPMNPEELAPALSHAEWPGAQAAMAAHRAHVVIWPLGPAKSPELALRDAIAITVAAAAFCTVAEAQAVLWFPSQTITEPKSFVAAARGIGEGRLPLLQWVRLVLAYIRPEPAGLRRSAVGTVGLSAFISRDVECLAQDEREHDELMSAAFAVASKGIMEGGLSPTTSQFEFAQGKVAGVRSVERGALLNAPCFQVTTGDAN